MALEFHPVSELFPLMDEEAFASLVSDIKEHGQREPILLAEGKVADGRNRYLACEKLGVPPQTKEWNGKGSLVSLVVSRNLHRRHLTESQRAMVGARIKPLFEDEAKARVLAAQETSPKRSGKAGANLHQPKNKGETGRSAKKAAAAVNVSTRSVATADKVLKNGTPDLAQAVESGKVAVSDAAKVADKPPVVQRLAIDAVTNGTAKTLRAAVAAVEEAADQPTDEVGIPVAGKMADVFAAREKFAALRNLLRQAAQLINEIAQSPGGIWSLA